MSRGLERFLVALRVADSQHADAIRAACPTIDLEAGEPYFRNSFPADALLVVDDGFVVVRATAPGGLRSVITSEGGPGRLLLPPSPEEVLFGLGASRLAVVSGDAFEPILGAPGAAQILLEQLTATIGEKQEAMGNFAFPRHIDRV